MNRTPFELVAIDEKTKVPVSFLVLFICGGFALFVLVAGAVFWGGVLQARADSMDGRISRAELAQERYAQEQLLVQTKLVEIKVLLENRIEDKSR